MENSQLLILLRRFSVEQMKRWGLFVNTPYHISNEKVRALGGYLHIQYPTWKTEHLLAERIWRNLFSTTPFKAGTFQNYVSDLLQCTLKFLSIEGFLADPDAQYEQQLKALQNLNLTKHSLRTLKKWRLHQEQKEALGPQDLLYTSRLATVEDTLRTGQQRHTRLNGLLEASDHLEYAHRFQQLILLAELLSRTKIIANNPELQRLEQHLAFFTQRPKLLEELPGVHIFVALIQLMRTPVAQQNSTPLEELLAKHDQLLPARERRYAYGLFLNFVVRKINLGDQQFYQKYFAIYRTLLEQGLLFQGRYLSEWTYTNIVTTGSRLKQWEWTRQFLEEYQPSLPPQVRYNAYHYNLALLRYEQKDFTAALLGLQEVEFKDAFYYQAAKAIQIKIYYENDDDEALSAQIAAAQQYIRRNRQISTKQKNSYLHFLQLVKRLLALRQQFTVWPEDRKAQKITQLQDYLTDTTYAATQKQWVSAELEKLLIT